ncbi:hypothetical protein BKA93DRAFT_722518 [Sparassis latifolia]|uniref:Tudor domain-containing protein n=1 Tax=Sparassis crispa TaxID=139825 RepID=A0A401G6W3_9APHY|nr:hypothetical protein SCP_0107710 [Sparassis crispa]GBE77889.1 hypothetical protein SCP_0107710 [Sparassis crispa]
MEAELETYQVQLSQVELALTSDPDNSELKSLRSELKELIGLTKATISQQEVAASSSKSENRKAAVAAASAKTFAAGDECLAKYSGDGQWYPARITSVGGSSGNWAYSVTFKGYNSTEMVNSSQLKAPPANYQPAPTSSAKRKLNALEEEEKERKKKKNEKKVETRAAKAKEQMAKQATWQKFAKKSEKKGIHIAGVSGTSIFKTPENPLGRVGVTGSGKGMTEVAPRAKHKFEAKDETA